MRGFSPFGPEPPRQQSQYMVGVTTIATPVDRLLTRIVSQSRQGHVQSLRAAPGPFHIDAVPTPYSSHPATPVGEYQVTPIG